MDYLTEEGELNKEDFMERKINFGHKPRKIGTKEAELLIARFIDNDQDLNIAEKFFVIRQLLIRILKEGKRKRMEEENARKIMLRGCK